MWYNISRMKKRIGMIYARTSVPNVFECDGWCCDCDFRFRCYTERSRTLTLSWEDAYDLYVKSLGKVGDMTHRDQLLRLVSKKYFDQP